MIAGNMPGMWRLAARNLGRHGRRTLATGAAIAIGCAALVFADGWARGIGEAIRNYAAESRIGALQVFGAGYFDAADAYPLEPTVDVAHLEKAFAAEGARITPRIRFVGTASNGEDATMMLGTGIRPSGEKAICPRFLVEDLVKGRGLTDEDEGAAVIGKGLAASLQADIGSSLTLEARAHNGRVNAIDVEVVGIASSNLPDEEKWLVVVPLGLAQRLTQLEGKATTAIVGIDEVAQADARRDALAAAAGSAYEVKTWREVGVFFEQAIKTFAFAEGFLLVVLALLAFLVVLNAAVLTTSERRLEVATLAALGAKRARLRGIFVREAALLGAIAGVIGAILGVVIALLAAAKGIPFEPPNQPRVLVHPAPHLGFAALLVVGACAACVLGNYLPAWWVSRQPPANSLRERA